ncbi:hypothetical protein ZWY2020_049094 [Hordeum vulgare]|nr:hypothetical protein ZWY2020_049094 [Hordeum vulgare]
MAASAAGHATVTEEVLRIVGTSDGEVPHWGSDDIQYVLEDFRRTSSCIAAKRGRLQDQMAAASRGRGRRARNRRAPVPAEGDAPTAPAPVYTRKGMGADRKRLRAQAGKAKKEHRRQEAVCGEFQELLADARLRDALRR